MTDGDRDIDQHAVNRFWHNYLSILDKNTVPVRSRAWYRKHVEMYIAAHENERLAAHTPQIVGDYLIAKGRKQNMREWQFRQLADALRLLFCGLIWPAWAAGYDWYQWRAFARDLEPDHPTLMRDANAFSLTASSRSPLALKIRHEHSELYLKFVKTIRIRQMAVRTEKTYEHWIIHFLRFHKWPDIERLKTTMIESYLEYLAVNRKVSSSTQKIALKVLVFLFREVLSTSMIYTHIIHKGGLAVQSPFDSL